MRCLGVRTTGQTEMTNHQQMKVKRILAAQGCASVCRQVVTLVPRRCSRQCGSPVSLQSTAASSMYTHPFTRDGIQCTTEDLRFYDRNYFGWLPYAPAFYPSIKLRYHNKSAGTISWALPVGYTVGAASCRTIVRSAVRFCLTISLLPTLSTLQPKLGQRPVGGQSGKCLERKSVRR